MYVYYGERRMTITSGDAAATSTAAAAMSMPWWLQQLPEMAAIAVAPVGFAIAVLTLAIKYNEWRIKVAQRRAVETEESDDYDLVVE